MLAKDYPINVFYGYVTDGKTEWSDTLQFTVKNNPRKFCPPALDAVLKNLPAHHPRVWLDRDEWDGFIKRSEGKTERKTTSNVPTKYLPPR